MDPSLFPFLFNNAPLPSQPPILGGGYVPPDQVAGSVGGNVAAAPPITTTPQPGAGNVVPGQGSFAPPTPTPPVGAAQAQGGGLGSLGSILQGVKAMTPARQDVKTPTAPHPAAVPAQRAIDLLTSLGIGPREAVGMGLFRR